MGKPDTERLKAVGDIDGLLQALKHRKADIRRRAAEALSDLPDERALNDLFAALKDQDAGVRDAAAHAFLGVLVVGLRGDNRNFRESCARLLSQLDDLITGVEYPRQRVLEALDGLVATDRDAGVRDEAAIASAVLGGAPEPVATEEAGPTDPWALAVGAARGFMAVLVQQGIASRVLRRYESDVVGDPAELAMFTVRKAGDTADEVILRSMGTALGIESTQGSPPTIDLGERFDRVQNAAFAAAERSVPIIVRRTTEADPLQFLGEACARASKGDTATVEELWHEILPVSERAASALGAQSDGAANAAALGAVLSSIPVAFEAALSMAQYAFSEQFRRMEDRYRYHNPPA
jgi:hypothetical protein